MKAFLRTFHFSCAKSTRFNVFHETSFRISFRRYFSKSQFHSNPARLQKPLQVRFKTDKPSNENAEENINTEQTHSHSDEAHVNEEHWQDSQPFVPTSNVYINNFTEQESGWNDRLQRSKRRKEDEERRWKEKYSNWEEKHNQVLQNYGHIKGARLKSGRIAYSTLLARNCWKRSTMHWGLFGGLTVCLASFCELAVPGISIIIAPAIFMTSFFKLLWHMAFASKGGSISKAMGGRLLPVNHEITQMTHELATRGDLNPTWISVYVIDTDVPNAFAAGLFRDTASVTLTQGIINLLTKDELKAVIAHELGHVMNGDMRQNLELVCILSAFYTVYRIGVRCVGSSDTSRNKQGASPALVMMVGGSLAYFTGKMLQLWISRQHEFAADAAAVALTGDISLADALLKIEGNLLVENKSNLENPLDAHSKSALYGHMFLARTPGMRQGLFAAITGKDANKDSLWEQTKRAFSTHPPIPDRVLAIQNDYQHLQKMIKEERANNFRL